MKRFKPLSPDYYNDPDTINRGLGKNLGTMDAAGWERRPWTRFERLLQWLDHIRLYFRLRRRRML